MDHADFRFRRYDPLILRNRLLVELRFVQRRRKVRVRGVIVRTRLDDVSQYEVGQEIKVENLFKVGDHIDVSGISKGHGFTGVIKRWSFAGFPGSHGTHEYFRHGGSIGNRSYPGRVRKGKKMAGHWGNEQVSTQNLEVIDIRADENLMLVRGAVPGAKQGVVILHPAIKR